MSKFQRRHYEHIAEEYPYRVVKGLDNMMDKRFENLSEQERFRIQAHLYAVIMQAFDSMFTDDNAAYQGRMFKNKLAKNYLLALRVDTKPSMRYTIADSTEMLS